MLKSNLFDYSDVYILMKGTTALVGQGAKAEAIAYDWNNKQITFTNCGPFTYHASKINKTYVDNAKDLDIMMLMYNLQEYTDNYSKSSGSLWQF